VRFSSLSITKHESAVGPMAASLHENGPEQRRPFAQFLRHPDERVGRYAESVAARVAVHHGDDEPSPTPC
jgi:hypothetical protein